MATTMIVPDYLQMGAIVKVNEWYGQIVDVAATAQGKVMVLITSPKAIFRNHRDVEYYAKRTRLNLEKLERLAGV